MSEQYAVIKSHNFDPEITTVLFDTAQEASDYARWLWQKHLDEEHENGSELMESECSFSDAEGYGRIRWTDDCVTEFSVSPVYKPREEYAAKKQKKSGENEDYREDPESVDTPYGKIRTFRKNDGESRGIIAMLYNENAGPIDLVDLTCTEKGMEIRVYGDVLCEDYTCRFEIAKESLEALDRPF